MPKVNSTNKVAYTRHEYSGPRKSRKKVQAALKRIHGNSSDKFYRPQAWRNKKQKVEEQTIGCPVVDSPQTTRTSNLSSVHDMPETYSRGTPKIRYEALPCSSSCNAVESVPEQVETVDMDWLQPDPDTEAYQLIVERKSSDNLSGLSGYRIVDLKHVIQWAFKMEKHRQSCESSQIEYVCEQRKGFHSLLTFKCSMCNETWQQSTEQEQKINTAFVWGTVTAGSYYTQAAHISSLMDIPTMTGETFRSIEKQLGNVWYDHLTEEIKKAGEQERSIAIEKGNVSSDGIPYTTVYVDGGWLKRSYGHNFDSSSGMACIIGKETKKCLYLGVRNKYCYTCQYYERTGSEVKSHGCCKNFTGPSTAMESNIIVEGFQRSEKMHNLRYLHFIGDGDSSVFANLKGKVSYGNKIMKIECKNHVIKNYTSALYKVCKRRNATPCHNHVKCILYKNDICTKDMMYGQQNEHVAKSMFMQQYAKTVRPSGLFIDKEFGFLAASPDGIIEAENAIVEIKCFPSLERKSQNIREASENRNFPIYLENDVLVMNKKHNYYYQVQGQLRISKMNKCYFICFISVTQPLTVIEVNRDEEFINAMMPKLITFFKTCILPEIILRRVRKNAKCLDIKELKGTNIAGTMPLTQEKRLDSNFSNNNDHSYLHKKFKKMASTMSVFPGNLPKTGENRLKETIVSSTACSFSISNGSIAAAHPEIEKIKTKADKQHLKVQDVEKNVQINYNDENSRLSNVNNFVQVTGQTSVTDEFSNKTENLENDLIKEAYNGGVGGRYICPYCKLSCAKPSVLQKHIRAHTNERPYPCVPCGFAFKTKSNLYKHQRSRTHALRMQGADVSATLNDDDLSGGSESDTSIPPTSVSETGSDASIIRAENVESNDSSELIIDTSMPTTSTSFSLIDNNRTKAIYKPKFRATLYQESDEKDKVKKSISPNADFLTEHISKIISDNEAIVDVIETPLQKKYGKIKQIAESKQFMTELAEIKSEPSPLNLTKSNHENENSFRKRSHSESFSQNDHQKHPLNPEGSIIKDLLLKTKMNGLTSVTGELIDGTLFICPLCQIIYRSADNLETHRMYYCKGNVSTNTISQKDMKSIRPENLFVRSNSINVRLPESPSNYSRSTNSTKSSPSRIKPDNLVILKPESNDVVAPLPSPGPLLGNTRLVDTRVSSEYARKNEGIKVKPLPSPKRRIDSRADTYSPRLIENISPRSNDLYSQPKIRCIDANSTALRTMDEMSQHMRHNSTSLQMFGGEVKILDHSGSTTTLRIEPSKNQLSPILIQQNLSPSKLGNDVEASSVVVRSGLHSGGTIMHNPPTPKEGLSTPQPQTPRISISTAPSISSANLPNIHDITHFQFPPLSAITAFNPLTLPPLSPSSPNGATTIFHGGKLIPHVPGIPGPNTPGVFVGNPNPHPKNVINSDTNKNTLQTPREDHHGNSIVNIQSSKGTVIKYDTQQLRNSKSPNSRLSKIDADEQTQDHFNIDMPHYISSIPIIKIKNVDETSLIPKSFSANLVKSILRHDGAVKRSSDGLPKTPVLKENINFPSHKLKNRDKFSSNHLFKNIEAKSEKELRNFNFENLITKTEIYNNQIPSSSEVQKNTNAQETPLDSAYNERSETSYFQKNIITKPAAEERKPKFLRPSTLPLKPGTFTPKRHHGITPNANTMPLVSPETPRPAKAYGQLYLNGNAYTYLGLKCSTKVFYCTINRPQPTYVPNQHFLSMYSNWQLLSELTPDPLGLSASSAMSLYDSRHRPQAVAVAVIKQDLVLTHSSQWKRIVKDNKQAIQYIDMKKTDENKFSVCDNVTTPKKEVTGGFESNEEYTYVRGRGRGRYVCSECGIRCKKPSMLKKHIRTHTDVRPYTCVHCAFSFKTKGNLTKHMKSKAHYKKCCELGINPNEGNDAEGGEMAQCSGETDDDTESDGDEGNEGETESSDTEAYKSRLPEHEAAHCLLSLGGSRPTTSATPGLITSARPSTYPYTPTALENFSTESNQERPSSPQNSPIDSRLSTENEPMDLSKTDVKTTQHNMPEIPTARESSVLASLASNTAKLPNHQTQWSNGEPMLHTYLTERALQDSKIKQSQLTSSLSKVRKVDLEKSTFTDSYCSMDSNNKIVTSLKSSFMTTVSSSRIIYSEAKMTDSESDNVLTSPVVLREEVSVIRESPVSTCSVNETKGSHIQTQSNAENAKHVVSEYLKHARINHIQTLEDSVQNQNEDSNDDNILVIREDNTKLDEQFSESESTKLPSLDHDPIARKVVIGVGGVAFKVTKGKDFENSSYSPGRLMEDGRRVCDFCNKTFTKPSQLRLHLNIHYMERPFRCSVCAVSFRTRGHLQKHERSGSHHNKVSMTSTFGAATSCNPRPFRCSDCNIAFRIHGHLAKHLRSKMHVMRLECLYKLPFGTFTEIERAGVSLTDIDTTDCASSLASLQSLARKLHEKDPTKLEYREPNGATLTGPSAGRDSSDDEDTALCENMSESEKDIEGKTIESNEGQDNDMRVNYSATDI